MAFDDAFGYGAFNSWLHDMLLIGDKTMQVLF